MSTPSRAAPRSLPHDVDDEVIEQRQFEVVDETILASRRDRYRERYPLTPAAWWDTTT